MCKDAPDLRLLNKKWREIIEVYPLCLALPLLYWFSYNSFKMNIKHAPKTSLLSRQSVISGTRVAGSFRSGLVGKTAGVGLIKLGRNMFCWLFREIIKIIIILLPSTQCMEFSLLYRCTFLLVFAREVILGNGQLVRDRRRRKARLALHEKTATWIRR